MKNIFKLEKILNYQQHLHFNVPYGEMKDLIKLADKHVPEELAEDALCRCPVSSPESFIDGYIEGFREGYGLGFQDSEDCDKR